MQEVPGPGENHRDAGLVAGCNYLGIPHRSAGLNHSDNPGPDRFLNAIGKGKERVAGENRSLRPLSGPLYGNADTVHPIWLTRPDADERLILRKDNRIRLYESTGVPGEGKITSNRVRKRSLGYDAPLAGSIRLGVSVLNE